MSLFVGLPLAVATAAVVWVAVVFNRLVALRQRTHGAWADIDAQLKRRHDLVPSLVETVKGYAAHERQTLEQVTERRGAAVRSAGDGSGPADSQLGNEGALVLALRGLFALAEDYPELRASERFGHLQEQLADIEDRLQNARRYYNAVVCDFNVAQEQFPAVLVARALGFRPGEFFEIESPIERQAVQVDLESWE